MTSEFEIFSKDLIKLNIYKEVVSDGTVLLKLFLDNNTNGSDYMSVIHDDDAVVNRYGCFNISEDKNGGFITVRPALVKMGLKIMFSCKVPFSESKSLTIFRNGVTEAEQTCDITYCNSIELAVSDGKYIMKVNFGNEQESSVQTQNTQSVSNVEKSVSQAETQTETDTQPEQKNKSNTETQAEISQQKLETIKAETEKDYEQYAEKLETIKEDCKFDRSLLEYYKDKDVVPIEKIFSELEEKIKSAEEQITLFITARQNKTKEIQE